MSDHWNSLANLLGTPSLSPQSKKGDAARPKQPEITADSHEPEELSPPEPVKTKETSRLRSSWDAVTSFFGIQGSEPETTSDAKGEEPATRDSKRSPAPKNSPAGKKNKPSFWDASEDDESPRAEPATAANPSVDSRDEFSAAPVEPELSFGEPKRSRGRRGGSRDESRSRAPRNEPQEESASGSSVEPVESAMDSREPARPQRDRGPRDSDSRERGGRERSSNRERSAPRDSSARDSSARDRGPREGQDLDRAEPRAESTASRNESASPRTERTSRNRSDDGRDANPERRGERRPPRRGRGMEETPVQPEVSESPLPPRERRPERSDSRRPSRRDEHRDEGTEVRAEDPVASEERPPRRERGGRSSAPRSSDREGGESTTDRSRSSERRDRNAPRGDRENNRTSDSRFKSGFGSGLDDSPRSSRFHDDDDDDLVDTTFEEVDSDHDDLDGEDDVLSSSDSERSEPRGDRDRSRVRRRGKRSDPKGQRSSRDIENDATEEEDREAVAAVARHSKIPSWSEAIGGLVAHNMENHQKAPSHHGGRSRGQGHRGRPS